MVHVFVSTLFSSLLVYRNFDCHKVFLNYKLQFRIIALPIYCNVIDEGEIDI